MTNKELRAKAREDLGGSIFHSKWLWALLVCVIISAISSIASSICFASLIIAGSLSLGQSKYFLNLARKKGGDKLDVLFEGFSNDFVGNMVLGLMITLYTLLWMLIPIAGFVLAIVKEYSYSMAFYIKADHPEYDWKACINSSKSLMKGNKWKLFCLDLSFIGWILLSFLTCGIGIFWVQPYMVSARTNFYRDLIYDADESAPVEGEAQEAVVIAE